MPYLLPLNETERLKTLELLEILDTDAEQEFDDLTRLAAQICGMPISTVSLIDDDRQWFKSKVGLDVSETPRESAFCAHTILKDEFFIVPDAAADERFAENPLVTGDPNIRFYAGAPLVTGEGHGLGSLCVIDTVPRELLPEQKEALKCLARQAMKLINLRRQAKQLSTANDDLHREIVEREKIEKILRLRDQAIATAAEGILISEIQPDDNVIIYINDSFERITKYSFDEVKGLNCRFLQGVETDPATVAVMREAIKKQEFCAVEILNYRKDGTPFWNALSISPVQDASGKATHFVGVQQDITERKLAEEKLQASEKRYRFLSESLPQQVWTANADGEINYGNHRTVEYFGQQTQKELFGMKWEKIIHPDDLEQTSARWTQAIKTGEHYETEYRLRRSDGEYRWHLAQAEPMLDDHGKIIKWFGTNTDIHDHKMVESVAREAAEYRNLFQNANDAILIFEAETEIVVDVNDKACEMYGFERDTFIGKSIKEISQDAGRHEARLRKLSERRISHSFETVQLRADGTPINLFINSSVIEYQGRSLVLSINRDITESKRAEEQLTHNALHDALTGLPNRTLFLEHLRHAIERNGMRGQKNFAVLFLDFDHFKVINDSLGHLEGDNLLRSIAKRLTDALRPGDIVARLGGDEFTILLDDLGKSGDVIQIVERIQTDLRQPFNLRGNEIFTSASIGIALSDANYTEPETMLRDADTAMYRAKANGKARHQIFNRAMHELVSSRLQLETELRQAIGREEFRIYYQPIINLQSGKIKGFESLVRWQHPTRGMVSPLDFISIAEETGLIVPLGEWILRESCRQLHEWQAANTLNPSLTMSVNLSAKQFTQKDLVERVIEIINDTRIEPDTLRLEITESYLMEDSEAAIATLKRLRALGIRLSIDDFGTGYSSLSYLPRLPVSYLKIDRSFVSQMHINPENREIVRTIILLAKNLNLEVIAEGIETVEQADYLKSLDCHFGQGYLYSKPVAVEQAAALITNDFSNDTAETKSNNSVFDLVSGVSH